MSRRYLIPTNLFYRENDPLPPDFPEPHLGDIYFNTVSKSLRAYYDDAWRDLRVQIDTGDPDNPASPIFQLESTDGSIVITDPGTGIVDIVVNPELLPSTGGGGGTAILSGTWDYQVQTTGPAPSGAIRTDGTSPVEGSSFVLWLSTTDKDGFNWGTLVTIEVGDRLVLRSTGGEVWIVTVLEIRGNTELLVQIETSTTTAPPKGQDINVSLTRPLPHEHDDQYVNVSGDTMTGGLNLQFGSGATNALLAGHTIVKKFGAADTTPVFQVQTGDGTDALVVDRAGAVTVPAPTAATHAARKQDVDAVAGDLTAHEAAADPHPQYLTQAEGDGLFLTQTEGDTRYVNVTGDTMTGPLRTTELLLDHAGVTNEAHFVAGMGDPNVQQPSVVGMGIYVDVTGGSGLWITDIPGDTTTWSQVGVSAHDHDGNYVQLADHGSADHSGLLATVAPIGHVTTAEGGSLDGDLRHVQYPSIQPSDLGLSSSIGVSDTIARADHVHKQPSLAELNAAAAAHTHDGSEIDSGTVAFIRLPTGTTSSTVAVGNHTHAYVPTTRTLTAGAGLTGGGALSANRTFDIGAGTGITVNADSIQINRTVVDSWYDPNGQAQTVMSTHEGSADPHAQYQRESEKGIANGYAPLDGSGVIPESYIPAVPPNELFSVANSTERTTFSTYSGNGWTLNYRDEVIQEDDGTLWVYVGPDPATSDADLVAGNWTQKSSGGVVSVNGETGAVTGFVKDSRSISAGSGLTGGGDLTANRTLNVGQGTGISVTATTVAIDRGVVDSWYEASGDIATAITAHHDAGSGDHDDRYYTEAEVDASLATKAESGHDHDSDYVNVSGDTMSGELRVNGDFSASGVVRTGSDPANFDTKPGYIWIREDIDSGVSDPVFDPSNYASVGHIHAGVYSPVGHTHAGDFALSTHTHPPDGHSHTGYLATQGGGVVVGNVEVQGMMSWDLARTDDPSPLRPGMLWVDTDEPGTSLGDPGQHFHDDRYYTESEVDAMIAGTNNQIPDIGSNRLRYNPGSVTSFTATTDYADIGVSQSMQFTRDTNVLIFFSCAFDVNNSNSLVHVMVEPALWVEPVSVRSDPKVDDGPIQVTTVTFARVAANVTATAKVQSRVFNGTATHAFWSPNLLIVPLSLES